MALREWPGRPASQIADMCGVQHNLVLSMRKTDVDESSTSPAKVKDSLGRMQPASKPRKQKEEKETDFIR
jgi:hypothetical protein